MSDEASLDSKPGSSKGPDEGRRAFMKAGVGAIGAGLAAIVVAPALRSILWPLAEDAGVTSGGGDFVIVGRRADFGATPVKVDIYADRVDAWNRTKNVKIGSAWVVEREGELRAFSTVCPHLGCAIDFDDSKQKFICPCHDSIFALDGASEAGPSPRGLDSLEHEARQEGELLALRYQRFKQDIADKVEV